MVIKAAKIVVTSWGRNFIVLNARDRKGWLSLWSLMSGAWVNLYLAEGVFGWFRVPLFQNTPARP